MAVVGSGGNDCQYCGDDDDNGGGMIMMVVLVVMMDMWH